MGNLGHTDCMNYRNASVSSTQLSSRAILQAVAGVSGHESLRARGLHF